MAEDDLNDMNPTPEGEPGDEATLTEEVDATDFMRKAKRWFRKDREHTKDWRLGAEEDYAFVAGEQWDAKDVALLKEASRPVITFNRIDPLIRSVSGEQINNAQEVRYLPRELGDAKVNDGLTSCAEWFRDQCDADDEESDAFWDAAVCGVGCTDTVVDLANPDEPMPNVSRVDSLEMYWDCDARKRNFGDARRIWRVRETTRDSAGMMFKDVPDSDLDASWARVDEKEGEVHDSDADKYEQDEKEENDKGEQKITIVQLQWWEPETYYRVVDPESGETIDMTVEQYERVSERMGKLGSPLDGVQLERRLYKQAFLGRTLLRPIGDPPCKDRFSFTFITGFRDRNTGTFYGLVRAMKDPQRWANKWLSQTMHIMNVNAKGGVMMETDAVENRREFEESFAKPNEVTWVPPGTLSNPAGAKVQPKPAATFPQGFYQLMQFAISSVRDVAGVNLEMIGMREADQAASLEYQRRQAGVAILAPLFRSMRRYHRNQGRVLLYYIQNSLNPQQLVRIIGDDGKKEFQPLQQVLAIKGASATYDIVVDEGPSSPNQKERVWALAQPLYPNLPPPVQLALLEYSPLPASVVEKIKSAAAEAADSPQAKLAEEMAKLQAMLVEAKTLLTKAQAAEAEGKALKHLDEITTPEVPPAAATNGAKPPSESINYKDIPPEAQAQMLAKAGIATDPMSAAQHAQRMAAGGGDPQAEMRKAALDKYKTDTKARSDAAKSRADATVRLRDTQTKAAVELRKTQQTAQTNREWMRAEAVTKDRQARIKAAADVAKAKITGKRPSPKGDK